MSLLLLFCLCLTPTKAYHFTWLEFAHFTFIVLFALHLPCLFLG